LQTENCDVNMLRDIYSSTAGIIIGNFTYCVVNNSTDLLISQRIRYSVFTLEEQETLFANHQRETYEDDYDIPENLNLLARSIDGIPIATMRIVFRKHGPYLADAMFGWEELAPLVGCSVDSLLRLTGISSRGAVLKKFRRKGVYMTMMRFAELLAWDNGVRYLVAVIAPENVASLSVTRLLGWREYGIGVSPRGWRGVCVWKPLIERPKMVA
jgi:GNAT superfamily N-acetyltransferase